MKPWPGWTCLMHLVFPVLSVAVDPVRQTFPWRIWLTRRLLMRSSDLENIFWGIFHQSKPLLEQPRYFCFQFKVLSLTRIFSSEGSLALQNHSHQLDRLDWCGSCFYASLRSQIQCRTHHLSLLQWNRSNHLFCWQSWFIIIIAWPNQSATGKSPRTVLGYY